MTDNRNDERADRAMDAVRAFTDSAFVEEGEQGLAQDLSDLLADVRHLCDRHGFAFAAIADKSETAYDGDVAEDGPKVAPAGVPAS